MINAGHNKKPTATSSNTELLDEIDQMLSGPENEIDVDALEARLTALQDRAPVMEDYDPLAEWSKLQDAYPVSFETGDEPKKKSKRRTGGKIHFARIAAIFAVVLLCSLVTVNALGYNPIHSFLRWVDDTIQVCINPSGVMELPPDVPCEYRSLREALDANGAEDAVCPTWVPRDYALREVTARQTDGVTLFNAFYVSERGGLFIRIYEVDGFSWSGVIESELNGTEYVHNDVTYYFTANNEASKAGWIIGQYSCEIIGQISEDELKQIINSMK